MTALELAAELRRDGVGHTTDGEWPLAAWTQYVARGVLRWTIPVALGGDERDPVDVLDGCIELARGDLAPAFILSQFQSACQRLMAAEESPAREKWLPRLAAGDAFTTIGISHLTTSRQHLGRPAVRVQSDGDDYRATGEIPWVTGGRHADVLVAGGALDDGRQVTFALPVDRPGLEVAAAWPLLALGGSATGPVILREAAVRRDEILAGPAPNVIRVGGSGGTGSLTTSALAVGHVLGCLDRLRAESQQRSDLNEVVAAFEADAEQVRRLILRAAGGQAGGDPAASSEVIRTRATSLALAASQALLTASKGAGFIAGRTPERLAREALFFLVWSCPQSVSTKLLREFSQCEDAF